MMKTKIVLALLCSLLTSSLFAQINVVVADITNESDEFYLNKWERSIPEILRSELSQVEGIVLLERSRLDAIFEEQKLVLAGFIDTSKAQQIRQLIGAEYILTGSIYKISKRFRVDVHIVRVETGQIRTEKAEAPDNKHLKEMIELLSNNISYHLTGEGEYKENVSIASYPTKYFLAATVGFGVAALLFDQSYNNNLEKYKDATELDKFDTYYDRANNANIWSKVMASLTATVLVGSLYCWIRNITADEINAHTKNNLKINPGIGFDQNREVRLSVQICF